MTLLVKGDEIDRLLEKYCAITGQTNKSEAVRQALAAQIVAISAREPMSSKILKVQDRAAKAGFQSTGDDLKPFMDDIWG